MKSVGIFDGCGTQYEDGVPIDLFVDEDEPGSESDPDVRLGIFGSPGHQQTKTLQAEAIEAINENELLRRELQEAHRREIDLVRRLRAAKESTLMEALEALLSSREECDVHDPYKGDECPWCQGRAIVSAVALGAPSRIEAPSP